MREKINNLVGKVIPVISLPSIDGLNPEEEIWRVFSNNISHVAQKLGVESDDLLQYYEQCSSLDHHDRFMNLATYLNINEETLFNGVFPVWFDNNLELVNKFIFSIIVNISELNQQDIETLASSMGLECFQFKEKQERQSLYFLMVKTYY